MSLTTDPNDPELERGPDIMPKPQNKKYLVLSEEERSKGFVRPVRDKYIHMGIEGPKNPLVDLTESELERFKDIGYIKYEKYPEGSNSIGRYWTQKDLDKINAGCKFETKMAQEIAETYARNPNFYGYTYCMYCKMHLPIDEFMWSNTNERLGS